MTGVDAAVVALESTQRCDVADDDKIVTVKKQTAQSSETPYHKPVIVADSLSKRFRWCSSVVDIPFGALCGKLFEVIFLGMRRRSASLFIRRSVSHDKETIEGTVRAKSQNKQRRLTGYISWLRDR
jgi:hypothetical protein